MKHETIICLDDLLREEFSQAKEFIYNLIREPILQATDINIGSSPRFKKYKNNLKKGFNVSYFLELTNQQAWNELYYKLPAKAENYLLQYIPKKCLVITYEQPKWLEKLLKKNDIDYIDIRISPIRFARDLYIAIHSNNNRITKKLAQFKVSEEEIRLEASLVIAQARNNPKPDLQDNSIIYIGQTENDASLVSKNGSFLSLKDFDIQKYINNKKLYYIPHPWAQDYAILEYQRLSKFANDVTLLNENIYNLLGSSFALNFLAISSGVLQEAHYFNKKAHMLHTSICPLNGKNSYSSIHFEQLIQPIFWHKILNIKRQNPKIKKLPPLIPNHLRELHNVWWGYGKFKKQFSIIDKESFQCSGGAKVISDINAIKMHLKV